MPVRWRSKDSITPLRGLAGSIGVPEVSSGIPSPPQSPPLAVRHTSTTANNTGAVKYSNGLGGRARRGGAAYTITEECERLFCETLRTVFLGEGNMARQDSLVMGMQNNTTSTNKMQLPKDVNDYGVDVRRYAEGRFMDSPSPETEMGGFGGIGEKGMVTEWLECWDYVGGNRFRGFVVEKEDGEKVMFVFFDQSVVGSDLKAGLMALLELCDISYFSCSRLIVGLDRNTESPLMEALMKDLGWIGFQLTTLNDFTNGDEITSPRWLFMDMDV